MNSLEAARAHQRVFLEQLRKRRASYSVNVRDIDIVVNPHVFPPTTDTHLLVKHINVKPGTRILDLTTGSGVSSVIAGLQGATGAAVDINPRAVKNAKENFARFG